MSPFKNEELNCLTASKFHHSRSADNKEEAANRWKYFLGYIAQFQDLTRHEFIASTSGASYFYGASL